jgi:hypothetical protein
MVFYSAFSDTIDWKHMGIEYRHCEFAGQWTSAEVEQRVIECGEAEKETGPISPIRLKSK